MVRSYLILLSCVFLWASNYIAGEILLREFSPVFLSEFRLTMVLLMFLIWAWLSKSFIRLTRREIVLFCLMGLIGYAINQTFFFNGLKYTSATNAALIFGLAPLCTVGFSAIFLKERITVNMIIGSLIALFGLYQVLSTNGVLEFHKGDLMVAGAMLTFSANFIFVRILSRRVSSFMTTVYSFLFGGVFFFPFGLIVENVSLSHPFSMWILAAASGIASQGLAGFLWNKEMNRVGAAKSSNLVNLQPPIVMVLGFFILHESITSQQIIGAVLVLFGVLFGTLQKNLFKRHAKFPSPTKAA